MGFIEAGSAVLFAIVVYAIFYGMAGVQIRKVLIADEEPITRVFWFLGATFISFMVWAMVGAVVYWGILIWFRIWLKQPHAWHAQILSATGWFPFGLILKHGPFPEGGLRGLVIFGGYPFVVLIAAGVVAICLRVRTWWDVMAERRRGVPPGEPARTREIVS
jgi:hypothetical protein